MDKLIGLALIVIPFISIKTQDIRELKGALAFVIMMVLGLLAIYSGKIKPFKNKWALVLVGFVWINIMLSPSSGLKFAGMELMQFWSWKPLCYLIAYLLGIIAIASDDRINVRFILKTMVWVGFIMSCFTILQSCWLDQFFGATGAIHEQWNIGGTLGHPTFVGSFVAMIIPLAFYLRKKSMAYVMIATVLITQSQVAIGAMIIGLSLYFACKGRKQLIGVIVCLIAISIGTAYLAYNKPGYITSSGRFNEWKRIIDDVKSPIRAGEEFGKYPITGRGLGSFYYTYHVIHSKVNQPCRLFQAHNEYLEWLYNCGIVGLVLLLLAIAHIYKKNFLKNEYRTALLSSFTCIAVCAGGLYVWQLGATMYFTAVIVGLLHSEVEDGYNSVNNI